ESHGRPERAGPRCRGVATARRVVRGGGPRRRRTGRRSMRADKVPRRRALLVGHGRMGKLIESLSSEYGCEVVGHVDRSNAGRPQDWPQADVAIDFSNGDAVPVNFPKLADRGLAVVIGTTG